MVPSVRRKPNQKKGKTSKADFMKRLSTMKKKAMELSTLCDISVCFLCYEAGGGLHVWPENRDDLMGILRKFKETSEVNRKKHMIDLQMFLDGEKRKDNDSSRVKNAETLNPDTDSEGKADPDLIERIHEMSDDDIPPLISRLDYELFELEVRRSEFMNSVDKDSTAETRVSVNVINIDDESSDQSLQEQTFGSGSILDLDFLDPIQNFDDAFGNFYDHYAGQPSPQIMMNGNQRNSENNDGIAEFNNSVDGNIRVSDQFWQELVNGSSGGPTTDLDFLNPIRNFDNALWRFDDPFAVHTSQDMIMNNNEWSLLPVNDSFAEASVFESPQFPLCQNFQAGIV